MAITLKRQLDNEEKALVLKRYGRKCFATGHAIPEQDSLHFDHIKAFALGGKSDIENIAPMCEHHNKAKGMLPLEDYRIKLQMEEFFKKGDRLTLKDLLKYFQEREDLAAFGARSVISQADSTVTLQGSHGTFQYQLYTCPTTGWNYFYASLPVALIDSDDDEEHKFGLQPRFLIFDKVFELFRHFQNHPVLQPSIGRYFAEKILLFDGQHKAAALLWTGRRSIECKIYINPDLRILNQTNISAHDKFAQTRFFSSVMVLKLGSQFGQDFENYKNREDSEPKTEKGFLEYLERVQDASMTRGERNKRFRSYLYNSILEDPENKMAKLISKGNRGSGENPLTVDMITRSFFSNFLNVNAVADNMASPAYMRDKEISNNVSLMNAFFERSLFAWNAGAASGDTTQTRLERIYSSKSIMAWSEIFKDALCAKLEITDEEDRSRPFYRDLGETEWKKIKAMADRLINWPQWSSPASSEIDTRLAGNKTDLKSWFRSQGLTTGYLLGASE
jgi:hypothetical protein